MDIDLIVCRNVFIYFSQKTIKKILNIFYNKLQPSGYLLTGHAEIISQNSGLIKFKKKLFAQSLIYQKPKLDEVIKTTTLLANQKSLYPVNQVVKNTKKSGLDVIPKPSKNISKRNINLLEVKPKNKEISSPEIDHLKEIEDIKMLLQKKVL
ncbi:Chemotaxis protein methyltransferase CheR [Crocosphaera watsonii WH 0005]|uniref:Chemotaxis protein methyltransferase CheR n=1 Tax=Crocosphaera watsonii WH 0005 TaxID=423472 RepID=T2IYD7_CROWT|nr:Chemotaxis protein methyltransferase CheR [Crocosphaera watsonii WH 0005]